MSEQATNSPPWVKVLDDVWMERQRADVRFGDGSIAGDAMTLFEKFAVLVEEVGEVAEALVLRIGDGKYRVGREHHAENLREELIQVAACAVGMIEGIDRDE